MWTKAELMQLIFDRERKVDEPSSPLQPEPENESHYDKMCRRALEAEARGEAVVMRDPKIRPKLPRKPSWEI